ncbi:MAG: sugar phosphate nucleotidyltransferase [Marinilabiliales bacterium]|nr:sugar phosphate nucleotidyltransferase [Marinilabiliales bacterium]
MQALGAFGFRGLHENKPTFTESIVPAVELMNELLAGDTLQIDLPELRKASEAVPLQRKYRILEHYQDLVKIHLESFSYVKGKVITYDNGSGFVFDCRGLRNPASVTELNDLTGFDPEVVEFFGNDDEAVAFVGDCTNIIRNSLPMMRRKGILDIRASFGCVGRAPPLRLVRRESCNNALCNTRCDSDNNPYGHRTMKAMIFAAGLGTRLGELSRERPKALVDVNGKTALRMTAEKLAAAGFHDLLVNIHHHPALMKEEIEKLRGDGFRITISDETAEPA